MLTIRRLCWFGALFGALALAAGAQQSGSQTSVPAQNKQQPSQHKTAAQENPFPSDASQHAAHQKQQTGSPDAPDDTQPAPPDQKPKSAAEENPFPEDVSKGAAAAKDSASSGTSSSSSNPDGDVPPEGDIPKDSGRRKLRKPSEKDIESGSLAGEGRASEDVRVGRFYLGRGNYKGAYSRFAEATQLDPVNIDAIYGLAASADGLHRSQEALTNYKLYLQIAPDGSDAKSARKALQVLSK